MADKNSKIETAENPDAKTTAKPTCDIVMPIAAMDNYSAEHWSDIKQILLDVIESAGFTGNLVSDAEETSIIQKTIVQNVYNNDIVICDISGKNPNVMFELGLRLAFDKATIVIKDFDTGFSFDTSPIEHLLYPKDLRFQSITDFKEKLKAKMLATYKKSITDPHYSTFLKSFGEFKVAQLESKEVSPNDFIIENLKDLKNEIRKLSRNYLHNGSLSQELNERISKRKEYISEANVYVDSEQNAQKFIELSSKVLGKRDYTVGILRFEGEFVVNFTFDPPLSRFVFDETTEFTRGRGFKDFHYIYN